MLVGWVPTNFEGIFVARPVRPLHATENKALSVFCPLIKLPWAAALSPDAFLHFRGDFAFRA